jgi:hypothetical protein
MFLTNKTNPFGCRNVLMAKAYSCSMRNNIIHCKIQRESISLNMKRIIILIVAIFLSLGAIAQTVENIRVEQDGENILVHYRIGGSTDEQTFNVTLSCSIDGGRQFEPLTVFGAVHENIRGGESNYTITWDVFEDLQEIGEAEFFVKIDLIDDSSIVQQQVKEQEGDQATMEPTDLTYFIAYRGSTAAPYGISTGITYKKWGGYLSFRYGRYEDLEDYFDWRIYMGGVTRQITNKGKYRLYAYAGAGAYYEFEEKQSTGLYSDYTTLIIDGGIINVYGRVSFTLGVEYATEENPSPVFGVGYMFPIKRKVKP